MPDLKLDPIFTAFMRCRDKAEADAWLRSEITYYVEHDPAPHRARALTREDGRRAILGHLSLNAGYYGKEIVDRVSDYFGNDGFIDLAGRDYAVGTVAAQGALRPPALAWYQRALACIRRHLGV